MVDQCDVVQSKSWGVIHGRSICVTGQIFSCYFVNILICYTMVFFRYMAVCILMFVRMVVDYMGGFKAVCKEMEGEQMSFRTPPCCCCCCCPGVYKQKVNRSGTFTCSFLLSKNIKVFKFTRILYVKQDGTLQIMYEHH